MPLQSTQEEASVFSRRYPEVMVEQLREMWKLCAANVKRSPLMEEAMTKMMKITIEMKWIGVHSMESTVVSESVPLLICISSHQDMSRFKLNFFLLII